MVNDTSGNKSCTIDLHCDFYEHGYLACPICNEWLVMRSKPELIQ